MQEYIFQKTGLEGLMQITPFCTADPRGFFSKPFERSVFAEHGIELTLWEELRSYSHKGVLRGLHFQRRCSQDKLVQVLHGAAYDVAVDLRRDSPTFGAWEGFYLTAENQRMLYIPKGFAHGFLVRSREAVVHYLCGGRYDPDSETGVRWNDPELRIHWPLEPGERPFLSPRDQSLPSFAEFRRRGGL